MFGASILVATVCSLSYPVAVQLADSEEEAHGLFWLTAISSAIIVTPLVLLSAQVVTTETHGIEVLLLWGAGAILAVVTNLWTALRSLVSRHERFNEVSASAVVDSGAQATSQIALGFSSLGGLGLTFGYVFGKLVSTITLVVYGRRHLRRAKNLWGVAGKWRRQSLLLTPTTLLNQASVTAIGPIVVTLFGTDLAGQFSLAMRMLAVPSALLGQSVAIVLFPKIARMTREGIETASSIESVATVLSLVAIPVFSVTLLLGPELFSLMFGSEWRDAGVAAAALSPWLAASLVASPLSSVLTVHQRLERLLFLGVIEAALRMGALGLGSTVDNWQLGLGLYSGAGLVIAFFGLSWVLGLSGTNIRKWLSTWSVHQGVILGMIAALACSRFVGLAEHQSLYTAMSVIVVALVFVTAGRDLRFVMRSVQSRNN